MDLSNGSITPFNGHAGNHSCWGDVLALSDDFTTFYVGYSRAKCVVAYNVATMHSTWSSGMPDLVNSVSCHAGMVLVGVAYSEFTVLGSDGHVLRHFGKVADGVYGHAVLKTGRVVCGHVHACLCMCVCMYVFLRKVNVFFFINEGFLSLAFYNFDEHIFVRRHCVTKF
jgi:hypothetical protein